MGSGIGEILKDLEYVEPQQLGKGSGFYIEFIARPSQSMTE